MSRNAAPTSPGSRGAPEALVRAPRDHRSRTGSPAPGPGPCRRGRAGARRHRGRRLPTARSIWWRSLYALVVALAIQIGTNYANDYSDGVRGTDAERVGPVRLVAGGLAAPARGEGGVVLRLRRRGRRRSRARPCDDAVAARRRRGLLRGRLVLLRRPAALRLRRLRRGLRLRLLRPRRGRRHGLRQPRARHRPRVLAASPSACSPRRCSWSTTSATSRPTGGRQEDARGALGAGRPGGSTRACVIGVVRARWSSSPSGGPSPCSRLLAVVAALPPLRRVLRRRRGSRPRRGPCRHRDRCSSPSAPCWPSGSPCEPAGGLAQAPAEEVAHERDEGVRALEADRVAGAGDDGEPGVAPDGLGGVARRCGRNLSSSAPDHDEDGHLELAEPVPQRRLGAGPGGPQRGGEAGGGVRQPRRPVGLLLAQVGEERSGEPVVDERRARRRRRLARARPRAARRPARRAVRLGLVADARVRPDEDEALDELGRLEGEVQAAPPAERVADVGWPCPPASPRARPPRSRPEPAAGTGERP